MSGIRSRRHRAHGSKKLHPLAIAAICVASAIVLTVLVGNLLYYWLDEETYRRLTEGDKEPPKAEDPYLAAVPDINAYPFVLGEDLGEVFGTPALSIALNSPDGTLAYTSDAATYLGRPMTDGVSLDETLGEVNAYSFYVSGIFAPQAFRETTPSHFRIETLHEAALLEEVAAVGCDELLLTSLPLTVSNLPVLTEYLRTVKSFLGNTPVGVAIPASILKSVDSWEITATLLTVCDFCTLDLSDEVIEDDPPLVGAVSPALLATLADYSYHISQYDLRITISASQSALLSSLELQMYPNFQVLPSLGEE